MTGNPPALASSSHRASNANSELSANGKKKVLISIVLNIFQIKFKLTLFQQTFQHLINPYSIIVVSSDDDYLPDLVDEVEPDENKVIR